MKKSSGLTDDGGAGLARRKSEEKSRTEKIAIMLKAHKVFILHNTVMRNDPYCLERFEKNFIVIPVVELQEVRKKANADVIDLGAWKFIQKLGEYERHNNHEKIFQTKSGSMVMLDSNGNNFEDLSPGLERNQENRIFLVSWNIINQLCQAKMEEKKKGLTESEIEAVRKKVIIVSSDTTIRYLGRQESLETQEYRSGNFISNINDLYTGKADLKIKASSEGMVEMIIEDDNGGNKIKVIRGQKIAKYVKIDKLYPNQCCTLNFEDKVKYAIYKKSKNLFRIVDQRPDPNLKNDADRIVARNMEHCFFEALARDKSITMITVSGDAGTAKTSMVAKATLDILARKSSMSATIFRPIVDNGEKLGFLPGGLDEKTGPYLQPVASAFRYVASDGKSNEASPPRGSIELDMSMKHGNANVVDIYINSGRISLESINFIQGRTLHNTVMVEDEAQDFKESETENTLTRIGKNGKIFMTGDLNQVHRPFLQPTASGFVWAIENFKHSESAAHIIFTEVFRHPFVEEVSKLRKN